VTSAGLLGRQYWWIVADFQNRLVIIGPKDSEAEANEFGYQKLDVPFEVVALQTRDRSKAGAQLKARKLDASADLGQSIQRSMRKSPGEYTRKWWGGSQQ